MRSADETEPDGELIGEPRFLVDLQGRWQEREADLQRILAAAISRPGVYPSGLLFLPNEAAPKCALLTASDDFLVPVVKAATALISSAGVERVERSLPGVAAVLPHAAPFAEADASQVFRALSWLDAGRVITRENVETFFRVESNYAEWDIPADESLRSVCQPPRMTNTESSLSCMNQLTGRIRASWV